MRSFHQHIVLGVALLFSASLFCFSPLCAQDPNIPTVSGTVTDENGEELPGVNVIIKGTEQGIVTNADGRYAVQVPEDGSLIFSHVGFITMEVPVLSREQIAISLDLDTRALKEVVVVGYGVEDIEKVTGSAYSLKKEDFNRGIINSPEDLFQGKIPGVDISKISGEPGSDSFIRIRGANTIRASNRPLIVIDGYPLDNVNLAPGNELSRVAYSSLNFINPEDIETIDILKDASAAAIYGSRGANGIILITTKKAKAGRSTLAYNTFFSHSQLRDKIRMLTADEFRAGQRDNGFGDDNIHSDTTATDWQDEAFRNAFSQQHDISFSAGTAKTNYRASISMLDQEGIIETSYLKRYTARTNIRHFGFNDRLSIDFNFTFGRTQQNQTTGFPAVQALQANPTWPVYNEDGSFYRWDQGQYTPVSSLLSTENIVTTNKLLSNVLAGFKLLNGLDFKINIGVENAKSESIYNYKSWDPNERTGEIGENQSGSFLFEGYLDYYRNFNGNHSINLLGGYSWQEFEVEKYSFGSKGFSSEILKFTDNLEAGQTALPPTSMHEKSKMQSFYGRFNYTYRDKYLLTFNYRLDGSSRFGENNRYGSFPAIGIGWRLHEESFIEGLSFINSLKLRASWGINGNQEIPNKISNYVLSTSLNSRYLLDGSGIFVPGYEYERTPNPHLKWEETHQMDIGLDFSLFDQRLWGTIDFFDKRTTDLIYQTPVSNAPTSFMWTNLDGVVHNKGFELELSGDIIRSSNFSWTSSVVFSSIENKLEDLPFDILVGGFYADGIGWTNIQILRNEEEIGSFYGYVFEGFDSLGNNILKSDSLTGEPEREIMGQALPDFTWGWTNTFQYQNFDLSIFFNGSHGNDVFKTTFNTSILKQSFPTGNNITPDMLSSEENFDNSNVYSSRYIEDASFIRLHYVTLGYNLNVASISWLQKLRIYLTGSNLYVWTPYTGYDPEVNILFGAGNGIPPLGVDGSAYPRARSFQLGLNIEF